MALPDWMPWWLAMPLLVLALPYALLALAVPFSVIALWRRLDGLEVRLDEIHGELQGLAMRLTAARHEPPEWPFRSQEHAGPEVDAPAERSLYGHARTPVPPAAPPTAPVADAPRPAPSPTAPPAPRMRPPDRSADRLVDEPSPRPRAAHERPVRAEPRLDWPRA